MASIAELKKRIDMPDLARRLGLKEGKGSKEGAMMFHSPGHKDSTASLSVSLKDGVWLFKDWSNPDGDHASGSVVDLVIYAGAAHDTAEAMRLLHEWYGIAFDKDDKPKEEKSMVEWLAEKCLANTDPMVEYLKSRGISDLAIAGALKSKAIGYNDWTSTKVAPNNSGHGGPAAAFIVRTLNPGKIVALDFRYLDADLNGGVKTQCQGEKQGYGWTSDIKRLHGARTVYIVESPINALSVETAFPTERHIAAFSIRGIGNVDHIDFGFLRGKQVRICLDHRDRVNERTHYRPGLKAAWDLHEKLATMDIAALFVDQESWEEGEDLNDVLQKEGAEGTSRALKIIEPWLIPGLPGKFDPHGRSRLFLPAHDIGKYWNYRVKDDHTQVVTKVEKNADDPDADPKLELGDLCGFRVAALSRVTIQSASATMTGDPDSMPRVQFAVSVQTPRHGAALQRKVFDDEDLHNLTRWEKFGPIYTPASMKRMINILERTAEIGARRAVNFVGLAWRDGELSANEGHMTYFTEPDKQCPYFNLAFPRGTESEARQVIEAFSRTMKQNAATLLLTWSLGGHLKQFLGFWPHMEMQANKGAGKSTLVKKLERAIAFSMLSGQSLQTEFRLVTSVSHTTHPVGWEELSTRRNEIIEKAIALLQETYQYTVNRRGSDMTEFLLCAPVLLAGEEVKADTLTGKLVRTDLTGKKADPIPDSLPRFPVWNWLQWLAKLDKAAVLERFESAKRFAHEGCCASSEDDGAKRMVQNYAALLTVWELLAEFCGLPDTFNNMPRDLLAEMNRHIKETEATREPWVWIVEILLSEISRGNYQHPFKWETVKDANGKAEFCLAVRASHVMDHIAHTPALRDKYNALPIKTDRVFKKQLLSAGVVHNPDFETTRGTIRMPHFMAISKDALEKFGLYATFSNETDTGSNN